MNIEKLAEAQPRKQMAGFAEKQVSGKNRPLRGPIRISKILAKSIRRLFPSANRGPKRSDESHIPDYEALRCVVSSAVKTVFKKGFTNNWVVAKYTFNRSKKAKPEMGRATKEKNPEEGKWG